MHFNSGFLKHRRWIILLFNTVVALCLLAPAVPAGAAVPLQVGERAADAGTPQTGVDATPWTPPSPAYRVSIDSDGLFRMDATYLAAAGLPLTSIDPASFRMFYMGDEVPIRVEDGGDGRLDGSDAVYFYGRSVDSLYLDRLLPTNKYTAASVFWLSYGGAAGLRMPQRSSVVGGAAPAPYPHREHIERQFTYRSAQPFLSGADHWFADSLNAPANGTGTRPYSFTISNIPAGTYTARLQVSLVGIKLGTHHLRVLVNDVQVFDDTISWTDLNLFQPVISFDQGLLVEGTNTVKLQLISSTAVSDSSYVDWVDVVYADSFVAEGNQLAFGDLTAGNWQYSVGGFSATDIEVYDVSTLTSVSRIVGLDISGTSPFSAGFGDAATGARRYLALTGANYKTPLQIEPVAYHTSAYTPSNLVTGQTGADYIIITHPDFWAEAERLAKYRALDYRVALVDVRQVYDQFNGGQMSAEAIHDFLRQAYLTWLTPAPAYVVLLGDGNYDMRNYKGNSGSTYLPPYLELVDPDLGETAADNRFVTLTGDDILPEMNIGRLVANTSSDAKAMVDKIIAYEGRYAGGCQCDGWNYNALFVADDLEGGGGNFYDYSDRVADGFADPPTNSVPLLPSGYTAIKKYLGLTCDIANNPSPANECRQQILDTYNKQGALLVSFVGHSTKTEWAAERLLDSGMISQMTNGPCLPIHLAMTCFEGSFHEIGANTQSLAEVAVRTPLHGAVASWSPTGFGLVSGHDYLETGLFLALFHQGIPQLGAAATWAKQYLWDTEPFGAHRDLIDTFVLLGDPALTVKTEAVCTSPTAVRMAGFAAQREFDGVRVTWQSVDELEVLGFNVMRRERDAADSDFAAVNDGLIMAENPGLASGSRYEFIDRDAGSNQAYDYALEIVKLNGTTESFGAAEVQRSRALLRKPPIITK